ncbi:MAG: hypothetical protein ABW136_07835 [Steroidobacteraceae bacterium]
MQIKLTIAAAALLASGFAAGAVGAEPRAAEKTMDAQMMKDCVAREQQRNNTGKAAAEVTCKEQREVQRETESTPAAKPAPISPTMEGASSAGHSSHSGVSSAQPAEKAAPVERATTTSREAR